MNHRMLRLLIVFLTLPFISMCSLTSKERKTDTIADIETGFKPLFNANDFEGWELMVRNNDDDIVNKVFSIQEGVIHIFHAMPEDYGTKTKKNAAHGIAVSKKTYSKFHIKFEYKWGKKLLNNYYSYQYDAGLFYHITQVKVLPKGLQYQVRYDHLKDKNHSGDILGPVQRVSYSDDTRKSFIAPWAGGVGFTADRGMFDASTEAVFHGVDGQWNQCELIVMGNEYAIHKLNGKVVNFATNFNVSEGPIALEAETAEIFWRNMVIKEFDETLPKEVFLQ